MAVEGKGGAGYVADTAGAEGDALERTPAFFEFGRGAARRILADPENVTPSSEAARLSRAGEP